MNIKSNILYLSYNGFHHMYVLLENSLVSWMLLERFMRKYSRQVINLFLASLFRVPHTS